MRPFRLDRDGSIWDIASYGRAAPGERLSLTAAQIERSTGRSREHPK